jgi:hypothetical protein
MDFEQVISTLVKSPLSDEIIHQIAFHLREQTNESLPLFISQSFQSLFILENWAWELFSQDCHQSNYLELFHTLASFNFMLIFHTNHIDADIKSSLLIPENISWINQIFQRIEKTEDENDPFLIIISRWFDNLSYLIHEHTQFESLPNFIHICQYIGQNYILSDQYKFYLTQLGQTQIPQSVFTAKQLFYMKTCSFIFRMYICST